MSAQQVTLQTFREARLSTTAAGISAGNPDQSAAFARLLQSVGARAEEATTRERSNNAPLKARATTDDGKGDATVAKPRSDERPSRTDERRTTVPDRETSDSSVKTAGDDETRDPSVNKTRDDDQASEKEPETTSDTAAPPSEPNTGKAEPEEAPTSPPTDDADPDRTATTNDGDVADAIPVVETFAPTDETTTLDGESAETTVAEEAAAEEAVAVAVVVPPAIIPPPPPPAETTDGDTTASSAKSIASATPSAPVDPNAGAAAGDAAENTTDDALPTGTGTAFDELLKAMTATDDNETVALPKAAATPPAPTDDTRNGTRIAQAARATETGESVMSVVVRAESSVVNEKAPETRTTVGADTTATIPESAGDMNAATDTTTSADTDDSPRVASRDTRDARGANGSGARSSNGDSSSNRDGSTKSGDPSTAGGTSTHTVETPANAAVNGSASGTTAAAVPTEAPVAATETNGVSLDGTTTGGAVATIAATREVDQTTHVATARATRGAVAVPEQIATGIRAGVKSGNDSFTIQLRPLELGTIDIKLDIGKDGRVSANVAADSPRTLELLMRDQKGLEQALRDAGLQTDTGSLSFSLRGDGNQNGNQEARERLAENRRGWGRGGDSSADEDDDLPPVSQAARTSTQGNGRLDVSV